MIENKFFKASGLYAIGNIFNKAISLLLLPVFTSLLSTSSYGIVSTYNAWVTILSTIIGLQLYQTLRSAYSEYFNSLDSYIYSLCLLTFISSSIGLIVITSINIFFPHTIDFYLAILCLLQSLMLSIINIELQKEMMALDYVKRTILLAAPNFIAAIIGIVLLLYIPSMDYYGRIVPMVLIYFLFGMVIVVNYWKNGKTLVSKEYWKYALTFSLPLVLHGLANTVLSTVDRTMITSMYSSSETAVYSVAYTLGMSVIVITSSLESVWIPWFNKKMADRSYEEINKIATKYVYIVTIFCMMAELGLSEILKLFVNEDYWKGIYVIPPIVLASFVIFLYSLSVDLEYYLKSTKRIAINTTIAALANLILNYLFIPKFGAVAAAYTTVVSYLILFFLHYIFARKLEGRLFPFKIYFWPIISLISCTIFTYVFIEHWIIRWGLIVFIAVISFIHIIRTINIMKS